MIVGQVALWCGGPCTPTWLTCDRLNVVQSSSASHKLRKQPSKIPGLSMDGKKLKIVDSNAM